MTKKSVLLTLLIGQTFLWTGSAFMSVLYRLYSFYTPIEACLYTEVLYYVLQAVGIVVFAYILKRKASFCDSQLFAPIAAAVTGAFTVLALTCADGAAVAAFGSLMNLCIGLLSGIYLTRLSSCVPQQDRGKVFGYSYAIGSVGTYLLSLPCDGTFLQTDHALVVFAVFVLASIALTRYLEPIIPQEEGGAKPPAVYRPNQKLIRLALCVPLLCSVVNGTGSYFVTANSAQGLNPVFTRAFYGAGLIAAGYINDKNRRFGAACCLIALVFPFISLALRYESGIAAFLSILSYIFYGFFSVYRVVLFADIAGKNTPLLYLSVFGLMAGRIGDAAGTFGGSMLASNQLSLTCLTAALFVIAALVFFALYHKLYMPKLSERKNTEMLLAEYEQRHDFTARQCEIFRMVVRGCSNTEISAELFLSESTVKFHMTNILKKVGCTNRTAMIADWKKSQTDGFCTEQNHGRIQVW